MDAEVIKYLGNLGYKNKTICLISGCNQPYVTKILKGDLKKSVEPLPSFTEKQEQRFKAASQLLELKYVADSRKEAALHMQVLRYLGLTAKEIYNGHYNVYSYREFEFLFRLKNLDKKSFSYNLYTTLSLDDFLSLF